MHGWWLTDLAAREGTPVAVAWVFWVIVSIVMHELAHGWTAIRCGDRTPIELGHMTWNPIVHMGIPSLVVFALVGITWGQMPVDPSRFRRRHDDALVSIAGPLMNVLLALSAAVGYVLWVGFGSGAWLGSPRMSNYELYVNMQSFFRLGLMLNIVLALFNMIPVPPLDGHRVLGSFVPAYRRLFHSEAGAVMGVILFVVMFRFAGDLLWGTARRATDEVLISLLRALIPNASGTTP